MKAPTRLDEKGRPLFPIAILTECSAQRGLGHLARCCALYDALAQVGAAPRLMVRGEADDRVLGERDHIAAEWSDPGAAAGLVRGMLAAVVDSYEVDLATYGAIAGEVHACAFFDDCDRLRYPPGIIINASITAADIPYETTEATQLLLGPRFAALRSAFWEVPQREPATGGLRTVFLALGGTDIRGLSDRLLAAVTQRLPGVDLRLPDGAWSAEQVRDAMLDSDAAVSAGGQTLIELVRAGVPTVALTVADNQVEHVSGWVRAGAVLEAGSWDDDDIVESVVAGLEALQDQAVRTRMARAGQAALDGRGALRVAKSLMCTALGRAVQLRLATQDDEAPLLDLHNDAEVRRTSHNPDRATPEQHHRWLTARLAHPEETQLLVGYFGPILAIQLRFDIQGEYALASESVAEPFRGFGWGWSQLERADEWLGRNRDDVRYIVGYPRADNLVSRRMLEATGYKLVDYEIHHPDWGTEGAAYYRLDLREI